MQKFGRPQTAAQPWVQQPIYQIAGRRFRRRIIGQAKRTPASETEPISRDLIIYGSSRIYEGISRALLATFVMVLDQAFAVQSCRARPGTQANSETFAVTSVAPLLNAWAAINRS